MVADGKVPRSDPHQVIKIKLHYQSSFGVNLTQNMILFPSKPVLTNLGEHWLSMLGDHSGLITVQGDHGLVEGFFGMSQLPVKVRDTAFKYTPEKPRDESPSHSCNDRNRNVELK